MKISFLWVAGNDTGETWSPLFPIEDLQTRSTQTCLEDLISYVKQGVHVLCLSPAALLETIGPFLRLHGAWCNSIFFLTAGKENQVIKCEKSPDRGGPFCLGGFPYTVALLQQLEAGLGKDSTAPEKSMTLPMNAPRTKHSLLSGTDKPAMSSSSAPASHRLEKACQPGGFGHSAMLYAPNPIVPRLQGLGGRRHHPTRRLSGAVGWGGGK